MNNPIVNLGVVHFVFAPKLREELREKAQNFPGLEKIIRDLIQISQNEGVAAIVRDDEEDKRRLWVFIDTYYLEFYDLRDGDGYRLAHINAIGLYVNNQLSRGYLLLKADWRRCENMRGPNGIPNGSSSSWDKIRRQWAQLIYIQRSQATQGSSKQVEVLSEEHRAFLTAVDDLIEATRKIEKEKRRNPVIITYASFDRTAETQHELRSVYVFHLTEKPKIGSRDMLRLTCNRELGRVFNLQETRMTVKFEKAIDELSIQSQGTFEIVAGETSFIAQQRAVEVLQKQESCNPHLLKVLVDRVYQPYMPSREVAVTALNEAQERAFRQAMTVQDLLLILGPPGTGKTRTIQEVVKGYQRQRKRVLVTSKTNRAVDNVLERLVSDDLQVVRFGHEDNISDTVKAQLIDAQAEKLQQEILSKTKDRAGLLDQLAVNELAVTKGMEQLERYGHEIKQLEQYQQEAQKHILARENFYQQQYRPILEPLLAQLKTIDRVLGRWQRRFAKAEERKRTLEQWQQMRFIGFIWIPILAFVTWRWRASQSNIQKYSLQSNEVKSTRDTAEQRMRREMQSDDMRNQYIQQFQQIAAECKPKQERAQDIIKYLHMQIEKLTPTTPPNTITAQNIVRYHSWYYQQKQLFTRHHQLLGTWRSTLEQRVKALYAELLLYADVVGATCIGVATVQALADASFHIAIVDEAGQINLLDLLVPLVRAEKAMLVGDHQQLPPFVDSDVKEWLDSLEGSDESSDTEEVAEKLETELLKKSMFELLYDAQKHPANTTRLNVQHRMPEVIADYAARQFYDSNLVTAQEKLEKILFNDPLFQTPLVFVDTSQSPRKTRFDTSVEWVDEKPRSVKGESIFNIHEAELIARLACMYQDQHIRWIVIVPYSAQAKRIREILDTMPIMAGVDTNHFVATVDSFQGGESPVVIYGFTRSNPWHNVGFLSEVRRLNVALTRAQQRLILVGDSQTLTTNQQSQGRQQKIIKKNIRFHTMMNDLYDHTKQHGLILSYDQCKRKIDDLLGSGVEQG